MSHDTANFRNSFDCNEQTQSERKYLQSNVWKHVTCHMQKIEGKIMQQANDRYKVTANSMCRG